MAKKALLKDHNNVEILPITRGELILDSSGKKAFHSNEFLATDSQPGLMSKEDKIKIDNMIATKVANKFTLKINSGTTEGTNLYSYDGASAKTLDIKPGTGIGFTTAAGVLTIANSGVRSIATGDNNGTIKVNTNGTSSNVAIKGLGSAAYTASTAYAVQQELSSSADLNTVITPGFYNAGGGNSVVNKPEGVEHFGLEVIHCASGTYYVQILFEESYSNLVWRRHCVNGTWSSWTKDVYTDTHYTTNLYVGSKSSNNNNNSNTSTTNGNTYLKLFDDSTLRHQYNIKGTGNTTITSDASGNITVNSPTTLTWENITDKPTTFTPSDHTHATNKITALTGYTKATAVSALAATDTLNAALGKLEYKADLGKAAYDWYSSVTAEDTDKLVNKWGEIVDFLDSVAEGTDITDEFVTRKTAQTVTGLKSFQAASTSTDITGVALKLTNSGWVGNMSTAMDFYNGRSYTVPNARIETKMVGSGSAGGTLIFYTQTKHASTNPNPNGLTERLRIDDNGTTKVTGAFTATSTVTGNSFVKSGGTSAQFLKADGSVDSNTYLTSYTDKKVRQSDTTTDKYRPLALGATTSSTAGSGLNTDVTDEVYVSNKLYVQPSSGSLFVGSLKSADIINLSGTTAESAQIKFSRTSYNYITFPSNGYLALATSASGAGIVAAVSSSGVSPYTTNVMTLGTSSLKWKEVHATKFFGELDGNAKTASSVAWGNVTGKPTMTDYVLNTDFAEKELASNVTEITKSLTVTTDWMDTGIKYTDIPASGTYIVQVYVDAQSDTIYYGYWSGVMSWYAGATNSSETDEILLHRAGHHLGRSIYLRTIASTNTAGTHLRLQIAASTTMSKAYNYKFKFKRIL